MNLDAFIQSLLSDGNIDAPPEGHLCYCGSVVEAVEAAGRILKQTSDNGECISWYLQVAAAMQILGTMAMVQLDGVPKETLLKRDGDPPPPKEQLDAMHKWRAACAAVPADLVKVLITMPDGHVNRLYDLALQFKHHK